MDSILCIYPLNDWQNSTIHLPKFQYDTIQANSLSELDTQLKQHYIFAILLCGFFQLPEDAGKISRICSYFPKIPCIIYGKVDDQSYYFQLAKIGIKDFVSYGDQDSLLEKLNELKDRSSFRIDLSDFNIEKNRYTQFWSRKFLNFIIEDKKFLKYNSVGAIASHLGTTTANLDMAFKKDCWLSPKQLLICLRNYYAAYLLDKTKLTCQEIAVRCGYANQFDFFKSFKNKTGLTAIHFRRNSSFQNYPSLILSKMKKKT